MDTARDKVPEGCLLSLSGWAGLSPSPQATDGEAGPEEVQELHRPRGMWCEELWKRDSVLPEAVRNAQLTRFHFCRTSQNL